MHFIKIFIAVVSVLVPQTVSAEAVADFEATVFVAAEQGGESDVLLRLFTLLDPPYEELFGSSGGNVKTNELLTPNGLEILLTSSTGLIKGYFAGRSEAQPTGLANVGTRGFLRIEAQNLRAVETRVALSVKLNGALGAAAKKGRDKEKVVAYSTLKLREVSPFGDIIHIDHATRIEADDNDPNTSSSLEFTDGHLIVLGPEETKIYWLDMINFGISASGDTSGFLGVEP